MKYTDVYNMLSKQAAKDDSDIIAPAVAGGGTLLGSILYGRARGADEVGSRAARALGSYKTSDYWTDLHNGVLSDVIRLKGGKQLDIPRNKWNTSSSFAKYMRRGNYAGGRDARLNKIIDRLSAKGAAKGGRMGLYAGIPLALLVSAMVNSWRGDKK